MALWANGWAVPAIQSNHAGVVASTAGRRWLIRLLIIAAQAITDRPNEGGNNAGGLK